MIHRAEKREDECCSAYDTEAKDGAVLPDFENSSNLTAINSKTTKDKLISWVCFGSLSS